MNNQTEDQIAMAMLAMAETFRSLQPPKVKMAIKCVRGALKLKISPPMCANAHLQLGKLLVFYTENYEEAKQNLEIAYQSLGSMGDYFATLKREALLLLCDVYIHGIPSPQMLGRITQMIRLEIQNTKPTGTDMNKLLLYYIEAASKAGLTDQAIECCDLGISTIRGKDTVLELYFRMTKALIYSRFNETQLSDPEHQTISDLMAKLDQNSPHAVNLRMFYICIQLTAMLTEGKTRSAKGLLRTMQVDTQKLSENNMVQSGIRWMDQVPITAFACLLTISSASYQCSLDRVNKYFSLVMRHINEYLAKAARAPCEYGILRSVQRMKMVSNELVAHCNIMTCKANEAMNNINDMVTFSTRLGVNCEISEDFAPIIQCVLALYCMYLRDMEKAEKHFTAALECKKASMKNVWIMTNANLCLLYLTQCKHAEYYEIADRLVANRVNPCTLVVRTNVRFVQAFHAFLLNKIQEFRTLSEECLVTAKTEDMFRMHNLSIMLCSCVLPVGIDALNSCISFSGKGYDYVLQQWSNAAMVRLMQASNQDSSQYQKTADDVENLLSKDAMNEVHRRHPAHALIEWFDGDATAFLPKDD